MKNTFNLLIDKTQPPQCWPVYFLSAVVGIIPIIVIANAFLPLSH